MIYDLENLDVPPDAQKEVDKALIDLWAAIKDFNRDWFSHGIHKISKAIKHLMDAYDYGAEVQSIINTLVEMVQNMVDEAIIEAIEKAGEEDKLVIKALERYSQALAKVSEGQFDKAINLFEIAYRNAMRARMRAFVCHIWKSFFN